jgi:hypothetical protein
MTTSMIYFHWSLDMLRFTAYNIVLKSLVMFYSYFKLTLPTEVNHD